MQAHSFALRCLLLIGWTLSGSVLVSRTAHAVIYRFPDSIPAEVLSDTVPFTFSPNKMDIGDFEPYVVSGDVPGLQLRFESASFEWVRSGEVLMVPRASLRVTVPGFVSGQLEVLDHSKKMLPDDGGVLTLATPVALLGPAAGNRIRLKLFSEGGTSTEVQLGVRHHRADVAPEPHSLGVDAGCSPYGVEATSLEIADGQWVFVGCRYVLGGSEFHTVPELELFVLWDGAVDGVSIDGVSTAASRPGVWVVRRGASPGEIEFKDSQGARFRISYRVPARFHSASLGFGIGPYSNSHRSPGVSGKSVIPLLTLYGSYYLSEPNRIVMFNATSFQRSFFSDTGIYFQTEQFTVLDRRLTMRILLGLHAIAFPSYQGTSLAFSGPQGAELTFRDFGLKRYNLALGAFIYPLINDRSYYNIWLRWGTARFFGEFNYIAWQEVLPKAIHGSESIGISFGGPLYSFF